LCRFIFGFGFRLQYVLYFVLYTERKHDKLNE
jgi:hypothetical protein